MATERHAVRGPDEMLRRIRGEYLEMPGLSLTLEQAQRLWGLDAKTCRDFLPSLGETRVLCDSRGDLRRSGGRTPGVAFYRRFAAS
jgi:hypothetical protein